MILADIFEIWKNAYPAGLTMLGLGTFFAIILLIACEKLKVQQDPKVEEILGALPRVDCGGCGYAGCASYAKAIAGNPNLIGKCAPGGDAVAGKIAKILNLQISGGGYPLRPIIHCNAHTKDKTFRGKYQGINTCLAANALANVQACKFGCLGSGDCVAVCKFNALKVVDGLAVVDYKKCTGCAACSYACPRGLIEMVPFSQENMITVACSSQENGKDTRQVCKVGCIGCGLCVKQSDLFKVENNYAKVDYKKYSPSQATETAMQKCPTKVILTRGPVINHNSAI